MAIVLCQQEAFVACKQVGLKIQEPVFSVSPPYFSLAEKSSGIPFSPTFTPLYKLRGLEKLLPNV